jgi:alpha-tubulin suppressor-like RCC1 family protein
LFVKTDGSLWGMGYNMFGQLGAGAPTDAKSPVQILPNGVASVAVGGDHTLILMTDGSLWATGYNKNGQVGIGSKDDAVLVPTQVFASGVTAVAGGLVHTMILKTDHSLWTVGYNNNGELGNGNGPGVLKPVQIRRPSLSKDD